MSLGRLREFNKDIYSFGDQPCLRAISIKSKPLENPSPMMVFNVVEENRVYFLPHACPRLV